MKKSVLFICADQWRWDCFGFMGHKHAHTPNIDKLVSKSAAFTSHFTNIIPCGPSRATMLTGLYPFIHRSVINGAPLDRRFTNIALEAKKIGYQPSLYGYTDTSYDPRELDKNDPRLFTYESPMPGFDPVCHLPHGNPEPWASYLEKKGINVKKPNDLYNCPAAKNDEGFAYKAWKIPTELSDTSYLADRAAEDLKKSRKPFFMHISFLKPHPPYCVSDPWHSLIDPSKLESDILDESKAYREKLHPLSEKIIESFEIKGNKTPEINYSKLTKKDIAKIQAVYLGMCAEVDFNIKKILKALDDSGQAKNTMIIFTSDHGEMLGQHWMFGKKGWWDQSYRIPLIISTPNCKPKFINEMTESVDLAPTILDWLGGEVPVDWNGRSLISNIENGKSKLPNREYVIFEWDFRDLYQNKDSKKLTLAPEECNLAVIRSNEWKYVHFPAFAPLLYNIKNDPNEKVNLASEPKYDKIKAEMLSKLLSHRIRHSERQMTNIKLTSKGPRASHGPTIRQIL